MPYAPKPKETSLAEQAARPGMLERLRTAANYIRTGEAWFGAGQPLQPVADAPEQATEGRAFDFPFAVNQNQTRRDSIAVSFDELRQLADNYDLARLLIETRKDQLTTLKWNLRYRDGKKKRDKRVEDLETFFFRPDRINSWQNWLRLLLEDMFVIDAATIYVRKTRGGQIYSLDVVDGATIKCLLDDYGRSPLPPSPAYQQILKGMPAVNYTREELLYLPRNIRSHKIYGLSPIEQIVRTVNLALLSQTFATQFFTEGNLPNLLLTTPPDWSAKQIQQFQEYWDTLRAGTNRQRSLFVPSGVETVNTRPPESLRDDFDEWLARLTCFAFSVEATPFIKQVNRSVADTNREQSLREGLAPACAWVKEFMDRNIQDCFDAKDIEFEWQIEEEVKPADRASINVSYVKAGILTADEVREELGREPLTEEQLKRITPNKEQFGDGDGDGDGEEQEDEEKSGKPKKKEKKPFEKLMKTAKTKIIRKVDEKQVAQLRKIISVFFMKAAEDLAESYENIDEFARKADGASMSDEEVALAMKSLDFSYWDVLPSLVVETISSAAIESGVSALAELKVVGVAPDLNMRYEAASYAKQRGAELIGKSPKKNKHDLTNSTRNMIAKTIQEAVENGWSPGKLAKELKQQYAFSAQRADVIARTELARADSAGSLAGWRASGVVNKKQWITAEDELTSADCRENQEIGPILLDAKWPNDIEHPPEHPNCRCAVVAVIE